MGALEELDDRIKAKGGQATLAPMDVTVPEAMAQLCRGIHDRWGHVDLWCHTAIHAGPLTPAGHVTPQDWTASVEVNVTATQRLIGMVEPLLLAAPAGRAVFFDDPRGGEKFFASYGATKAAQIALARSWQAETVQHRPAGRDRHAAADADGGCGRGSFPARTARALAAPGGGARLQVLAAIWPRRGPPRALPGQHSL